MNEGSGSVQNNNEHHRMWVAFDQNILAEREGFEPSKRFYPFTTLAVWCFRPLSHLSKGRGSIRSASLYAKPIPRSPAPFSYIHTTCTLPLREAAHPPSNILSPPSTHLRPTHQNLRTR